MYAALAAEDGKAVETRRILIFPAVTGWHGLEVEHSSAAIVPFVACFPKSTTAEFCIKPGSIKAKTAGFLEIGRTIWRELRSATESGFPPAADCTPAAKLMIKKKAGCPTFRGFRNVVCLEIGRRAPLD
jgi:hypothetical protein